MNDKTAEKEKKVYVSLYKKDSASYSLALLSIVAELVYVISILDVMPVTYWMGITIMVNIFVIFAQFTCAVKVNVYNKQWSIIAIVMGMYLLFRQFALVPVVLKPYEREQIIGIANLAGAALLILVGIVSVQKCDKREKLQKKLSTLDKN